MSFDAYKIAISISLVNNVTSGLLGMSSQFTKVHGDAQKLQAQLDKIKLTMIKGGAMLGVGAFGLGMIGKTIEPAKEYTHQLALMNTAGMKHLEIVRATNAAWAASKSVPTSSASENLSTVRELRMVFGDTSHAIENMPVVQQLQAILRDVRGGGHGKDEAYEVAKALELKGAVKTPEEFKTQADLMAKAIVASGGKVGATDFLGTFKYGRSATAGWSDAFSYTILPTLIQEMKAAGGSGGAGGPGNALMSAYAAVVGGTIPQKSLKIWQQLGLLDPSKIVWDKVGAAKGVAPGGIRGSSEFQANPYQWTQDFLIPALKKAGYQTEAQQKQAMQYLFPNRTAGFVMSQMALQPWKFERDQKLIAGAQGLGAYNQLLKTDPEMAQMAMHKQWESLLAIIGYQIMPVLIKGMLKAIEVMRDLAAFMQKHATAAKILVGAFTGLSAAMAFGGAVLLLKAAFMGLSLAIGSGAIGGGVIGLVSGLGRAFIGISTAVMTNPSVLALLAAAGVGVAAGTLVGKGINAGISAATGRDESLGGWLYDATHGDGGFVKPAGGAKANVTVNTTLDRRGFSSMVAGDLAKAQFGGLGSGTYDLGIAQPGVNVRTN